MASSRPRSNAAKQWIIHSLQEVLHRESAERSGGATTSTDARRRDQDGLPPEASSFRYLVSGAASRVRIIFWIGGPSVIV